MSDRITYADLLESVSDKTSAPKQQVLDMMKGIAGVIRRGLERDGRVVIRGLGRFELRWQDAHMGRNPQTGEPLEIPAHSHVHFLPESNLRRFINRKYAHLKPEMLPTAEPTEDTVSEPESATVIEAPSEERPSDDDVQEKKKHKKWLWLIPVAVVILLLILLWPRPEPEPATTQETETIRQAPAEPQKPSEEPTPAVSAGIPGSDHRVHAGDRLWGLSDRYYGSVYLWPHIYRVNDDIITNPDILQIGKTIAIPPLEGKPGHLSVSDKESIADGYMDIYFVYQRMRKPNSYTYLWVARQLGGPALMESQGDQIAERDKVRSNALKGSTRIE
jgi:integration host factor subunit beta